MKLFSITVSIVVLLTAQADAQYYRRYPNRCYQEGGFYCNTVPRDDYEERWTVEVQVERGWASVGTFDSYEAARRAKAGFEYADPQGIYRLRHLYR